MRLTKANVAQLSLPVGKTEVLVFDDALPGFGLRIRAGGKRTWVAQYRLGTKQRRISLGSTERLDADAARRKAKEALAKVSLGADPQTEKQEARRQASITMGALVPRYLEFVQGRHRPNYHADVRRYLTTHWSALSEKPIDRIDRADVAAGLTKIAKDRGVYSANRARASLSAYFSWALGEGLVTANPTVATNMPGELVKRDRVLSDDELRLVWNAAGADHFGSIVKLLILTAARREEIGGMSWAEISGDLLRIAPERSKNRLPHDVPLSPPAKDIIDTLPRRDGRDLAFGSGRGPFQGWSKSKVDLDARIVQAMKDRLGPKAVLQPWRVHDLRRTAATKMADLGVQPHIIEAVLGHVSGFRAGVAGTYNRAAYLPEKRAALALWGDHVGRMVGS